MARLLLFLIKIIFYFFRSKKSLISENFMLKKELEKKGIKTLDDFNDYMLDISKDMFDVLFNGELQNTLVIRSMIKNTTRRVS